MECAGSQRTAIAIVIVAGCGWLLHACASAPARDWGQFDQLHQAAPAPKRVVGNTPVSPEDYARFLRWGELWFRFATFGSERTITDIVGLMNGTVQLPCPGSTDPQCRVDASVLPFYAAAIDKLDGVQGNLYTGNGGPEGTGYTHDLVLEFPPGATLRGFQLPARLHTGMDVEAGSAWPIGIATVPIAQGEADQPYFVHESQLNAGPAPGRSPVRLGMTCALCHFSLDVDWDGKTDLRSALSDRPTPGSPYRPQDAWPIGNQDLHIGWLFALSQNPLLGFSVFSGPVGRSEPKDVLQWVNWIRDNYERAPTPVMREVTRGMLAHPRGYADISPNGIQDNEQFPILLTHENWPSDYDGALINAGDRNSSVWTSAFDFTTLVGLASDRAAAGQSFLYWEPVSPYRDLPSERLADMMVLHSPAVMRDPNSRARWRQDVTGTSDGVPGLLSNDAVVVMEGPGGILPPEILNHPENVKHGRIRVPADYGDDAEARGTMMALVGLRIRTPPEMLAEVDAKALQARYPKLSLDELASDAVSVMLDNNQSPPNLSPLLANARALVPRGYEVFKDAGCAKCHAGPIFADNLVHPISLAREVAIGLPSGPSTAGWRRTELVRRAGPAIGTHPERAISTRTLQLYAAPDYDPATGKATAEGSPLNGFFGERTMGYKTTQLRYLWGSAPYLHDGGVGVALRPGTAPASDDLRTLLRRAPADNWYGMGLILAHRERVPESSLRANAALSLQAMLLASERARVVDANRARVYPLTPGEHGANAFDEAPPEVLSMHELGIAGTGHDFYIDDEPGGERITALVAFLLALDDRPGEIAAPTQGASTSIGN